MSVALSHGEGPLPEGWRWARLGDVCIVNPRRPPLERPTTAPTTFLPMSAVAESGRGIVAAETRPYDVIARGYTYFAEGDVLFAKITPCMQNGKHAIARDLRNGIGFGSTEFHVLRPLKGLTAEWLLSFLLQPTVLNEAISQFTGAVGQQRVPADYLAGLSMPLPPLSEQRRISAILKEQMGAVDKAQAAVQAQLKAARALSGAYLRDVFESQEAKQWPYAPLGSVSKLVNGEAFRPSDWSSSGTPIIRIQNLNNRLSTYNYWDGPLAGRVKVCCGDVLLAWSGTPGTSFGAHLWDRGQAVLNQHIFRVDLDLQRVDPQWAVLAINQRLGVMVGKAHGAVGLRHVTRAEVSALSIPLPQLSIQQGLAGELAARQDAVKHLTELLEGTLAAVDALPSALLSQALQGGY